MKLNFSKSENGLLPAIIQDVKTKNVLMLGYMNAKALKITKDTGKVTFFSRSKNRIWTKGEESGNFLELKSIKEDCDQDTLLILANPKGPICHRGTETCWGDQNKVSYGFLSNLENTISKRKKSPKKHSYVSSLFKKGINNIAQKVGEEAIETIIEAKDNDDELFLNESADLLFHYLILLQAKGFYLDDVVKKLTTREK